MQSNSFDHTRFKLREAVTNQDGKTSGSGLIGFLMGLVAVLTALGGLTGWYLELWGWTEIFEYAIKLAGISALLMGARKGVEAQKKASNTKG